MSAPRNIKEWLQGLPIPWLFSGPVGKQDAASQGAVYDRQVELLREAVKARMPDYTPTDGLAHVGGDRVLIQGPTESDANFRIRMKRAWIDWPRAGTAAELLLQLHWQGIPSAVIIQQNGRAYRLNGTITPTTDPIAGTPTPITNGTRYGHLDVLNLYGPLSPLTNVPPGPTPIPATNGWTTFDTNIEFTSRFAILVPVPTWFPTPTDAQLAIYRSIINTWRNSTATCLGIYAKGADGRFFDWPIATFDDLSSGTFNDLTATVAVYEVAP